MLCENISEDAIRQNGARASHGAAANPLPPEEMLNYVHSLKKTIEGAAAAVVINLDATDLQEWIDKREMKIVVPMTLESNNTDLSIDRSSQRNSLLVAIVADGTFLKARTIMP
jgi:hypothetical protein